MFSDKTASIFEAGGGGGDCMIVSSLGSKEAAILILGFWLFVVIPSEVAVNGSDEKRG